MPYNQELTLTNSKCKNKKENGDSAAQRVVWMQQTRDPKNIEKRARKNG